MPNDPKEPTQAPSLPPPADAPPINGFGTEMEIRGDVERINGFGTESIPLSEVPPRRTRR